MAWSEIVYNAGTARIVSARILFDKSTNGGSSWGNDIAVASIDPMPTPGMPPPADRMPGVGFRVNSDPTLAVDRSSGPSRGHIYIAWADESGVGGSGPDILFTRSTNGGQTWSTPIRASDDTNHEYQWFPRMAVDAQGSVEIVFMDRRDAPGSPRYHVYHARSENAGLSFSSNSRITEVISDAVHDGFHRNEPNYAGGFIGDYIGMAAAPNGLHPLWTDCRGDNAEAYTTRQPGPLDFVAATTPQGDVGNSEGVAWGDYDNDGFQDLYIANAGTASKLLHNSGTGSFTDVTTGPLASIGSSNAGVWGDYDNDGDIDLYVARGSGQANKLFRNDGDGVFVDVTSGPLGDLGDSRAATWVDYDRDGDIDLLIVNYDTSSKLIRNDGCGVFTNVTSAPLAGVLHGNAAAWGDYDNDGDPDLYLVRLGDGGSPGGANKLFRNEGGGVFTDLEFDPGAGILADPWDGRAAAWGDYDNDGRLDLFLVNKITSDRLFHNNGDGVFQERTSLPLVDVGSGVAWSDYDNDGDLDVFLSNDGVDELLRNDGGGAFTPLSSGALGDPEDGRGAAWADIDGDGDTDLYVADNGPNQLLRNLAGACSGNWLQVVLRGTDSNRSGIGAQIRVVTGELKQTREVEGGGGYRSQNSLPAEFGVGSAVSVDTLRIRWPSGIIQVLTDLTPPPGQHGQVVTVEECPGEPASPVTSTMSGWAVENPDPSSMTLHFAFRTSHKAQQFQVRYRVMGTTTWNYAMCSAANGWCLFNCNGTYEAIMTYSPCEETKFEWQARALVQAGASCQPWSAWTPLAPKTFKAFCIQEP